VPPSHCRELRGRLVRVFFGVVGHAEIATCCARASPAHPSDGRLRH
jgi:hypothetical protein